MPVETASTIDQLNALWPLHTDPESQGDSHLRLIKAALQTTFPNITAPVTPTAHALNFLLPIETKVSSVPAALTIGDVIIQWGTFAFSGASPVDVVLPVAFPTAGLCGLASLSNSPWGPTDPVAAFKVSFPLLTTIRITASGSGDATTATGWWLAIGY